MTAFYGYLIFFLIQVVLLLPIIVNIGRQIDIKMFLFPNDTIGIGPQNPVSCMDVIWLLPLLFGLVQVEPFVRHKQTHTENEWHSIWLCRPEENNGVRNPARKKQGPVSGLNNLHGIDYAQTCVLPDTTLSALSVTFFWDCYWYRGKPIILLTPYILYSLHPLCLQKINNSTRFLRSLNHYLSHCQWVML